MMGRRNKGKKGQRVLENLGGEQHGMTVMLFLFFFYLIGNIIRNLAYWIFCGYKLYTFSTRQVYGEDGFYSIKLFVLGVV